MSAKKKKYSSFEPGELFQNVFKHPRTYGIVLHRVVDRPPTYLGGEAYKFSDEQIRAGKEHIYDVLSMKCDNIDIEVIHANWMKKVK